MNLKFFDVTKEYTDFLRMYDEKIPYIQYNRKDKFICGIVLSINECNYYTPISSFNQKQFTSIPIYHK